MIDRVRAYVYFPVMLLRFLSSLFFASGIVLTAQANTQPYPDSDSSDGYDTGFYAEAYSGGYDSAPAPAGESASRPVFPTQSYFELLGPMDSRNGRGSVDIQNWMTDLNLCRMSSGSWNFSSTAALRLSWFNGKGADEMDVESQNFRRITMKVLTMQLNSTSVMDIVAYGGAAVGMAVALSEFLKGNISISGTICIVLLASEFFLPLRLLGSFFHIAMNGMAASDKIFKILDLPEPQTGDKNMPDDSLDISFKNVHFAYEENREILKGIDLYLPAGSFVSLVGESGCGKSTIAGIISAKNRGFTGEITIGGVSLSEVSESDLMKHVVLVRHNSYLFKGTIEENLRMVKPDATEEEMNTVLKKVNLLGFLQTQDGLQTKLLEKASNLSGGQCQRLVIARALLYDAAVYIFDEAASNIDVESEELIMDVIHELSRTKTVLLISHRLANVVKSDQIYFLKNGEIQEHGKHEELMQKDGEYRHLYESQMALENYGRQVNRDV